MTRNQRGHNIWRSHFSSPRTWRNNKNWWCNKKLELILQCWKFCLGKKQFNREKGKGKPTLDMYVVLLQLLCFYYSVSVDVDSWCRLYFIDKETRRRGMFYMYSNFLQHQQPRSFMEMKWESYRYYVHGVTSQ